MSRSTCNCFLPSLLRLLRGTQVYRRAHRDIHVDVHSLMGVESSRVEYQSVSLTNVQKGWVGANLQRSPHCLDARESIPGCLLGSLFGDFEENTRKKIRNRVMLEKMVLNLSRTHLEEPKMNFDLGALGSVSMFCLSFFELRGRRSRV